jgi:hypothetical protein
MAHRPIEKPFTKEQMDSFKAEMHAAIDAELEAIIKNQTGDFGLWLVYIQEKQEIVIQICHQIPLWNSRKKEQSWLDDNSPWGMNKALSLWIKERDGRKGKRAIARSHGRVSAVELAMAVLAAIKNQSSIRDIQPAPPAKKS